MKKKDILKNIGGLVVWRRTGHGVYSDTYTPVIVLDYGLYVSKVVDGEGEEERLVQYTKLEEPTYAVNKPMVALAVPDPHGDGRWHPHTVSSAAIFPVSYVEELIPEGDPPVTMEEANRAFDKASKALWKELVENAPDGWEPNSFLGVHLVGDNPDHAMVEVRAYVRVPMDGTAAEVLRCQEVQREAINHQGSRYVTKSGNRRRARLQDPLRLLKR